MDKYESQKVFTYMIMHDLKHPIEAIISIIQSTKRDLTDANKKLDGLRILRQKLRTLLDKSSLKRSPRNLEQSPQFTFDTFGCQISF